MCASPSFSLSLPFFLALSLSLSVSLCLILRGKGRHDWMKLCVARRESGPARVPISTLWTGVDRPQCEEVTSTDHSSCEGGKNVTVTQCDDYVSFGKKKGLISNAENNVVLIEEQKSMYNCAKWPRTILTTGISNKAVGRGRHSVANVASHGEQPNAKPDIEPNPCIFYRFGTVHRRVRLYQQPKLPWGLLCE